jgi:uncharacterized membrane protein
MLFTSVKFIHFFSLIFLMASSVTKNILVRKSSVPSISISRCRVADRVSGAAAGLMIVSGIGMLYLSPKGFPFYGGNALFWVKIALLVIASIFIIRTKIFFRNSLNLRQSGQTKIPSSIRGILVFDLASLLAMVTLGVLIAGGSMVNF